MFQFFKIFFSIQENQSKEKPKSEKIPNSGLQSAREAVIMTISGK